MKNKILALVAAGSLAFMMQACGDDNSSSPFEAPAEDVTLSSSSESDEESSSSQVKDLSSSSVKDDSSSSAKEDGKSSSSVKDDSSSSTKEEGDSSSSVKDDSSSSAKEDGDSSSSVKEDSSSSAKEDGDSSSSVKDDSSSSAEEEGESSSSDESYVLKADAYFFFNDPNYESQVGEFRWTIDGKVSSGKLEFYQDSKIVRAGGELFVLERLGHDNVVKINANSNAVAWQSALGTNANPSDIVKVGSVYWVSGEGDDTIYALDADGNPTGGIDLSSFMSEGGTSANAIDMEVSGDTLFVLMQRYIVDGWNITYPKGLLALFSIKNMENDYQDASNALATIELSTTNPMSVKVVNGQVYVGTHADYNGDYGVDADAKRGIEKVDLAAGTSSVYVSGTKLGGGVITMDVDYAADKAFVAVRGAFYGAASVVEVNLATGTVKTIDGLNDPEGGLSYDAKSGLLLIGDRGYGSVAVYAYDGEKVNKVEYASEITFAPYSISF